MRKDSCKHEWLEKTGYFVHPIEIELRPNTTYMITPLLDTLRALFKHPQIKQLYFEGNSPNTRNTINSFKDDENFKNNQLYKHDPSSMQIVLFNDGYETNNPLGDNRKEDKVNTTYFKLGNIHASYQSVDYFTQTLMICDSRLVKEFGYNKLLEPIIHEIKLLETEGIVINYNNREIVLKRTNFIFPSRQLSIKWSRWIC